MRYQDKLIGAVTVDGDVPPPNGAEALSAVPGRDVDPDGMYGRLLAAPDQIDVAKEIAAGVTITPIRHPNGIVAVGLGGSSAAAELAADAYRNSFVAPYLLVRRRELPPWVDRDTIVISTSWSGNTDETVDATRAALERGANVIAIASGGALVDLSERHGFPLLRTPGGMMPRLALPVMFVLTESALRRSGAISGEAESSDLRRAIEAVAAACSLGGPGQGNPARQVAEAVSGRWAAIFAGAGLRGVGRRWREQINENAKLWASADELPAAHHNALIAIRSVREADGAVVVLETPDDVALNDVAFGQVDSGLIRVRFGEDRSPAGLLAAAMVGDFASLYLAYLRRVDPTPVDSVNVIKARLATDLTSR